MLVAGNLLLVEGAYGLCGTQMYLFGPSRSCHYALHLDRHVVVMDEVLYTYAASLYMLPSSLSHPTFCMK